MKRFKLTPKPFFTASVAGLMFSVPALADDVESEDRGPYYEDDAWYDISEWFDGNDYNPTDESIGTWDDETYDHSDDTGNDLDNDLWYGYDDRNDEDDWFYDYYDDGDRTYYDWSSNGIFDFSYRYYDYNNDGLYDAYYIMHDDDDDGFYDHFDYYSFNTDISSTVLAADKSDADAQQSPDSRQHRVRGTVIRTKKVSVRNSGKHLVAELKKSDGGTCLVDLGPADELDDDFKVKKDGTLSAWGPITKVGDRKVLIADRLQMNGESAQIDRAQRTTRGTIKSTYQATVRGHKQMMALIERSDGEKCAIDLGPVHRLEPTLKSGERIKVEGSMVRANGKPILMVQTLHADGGEFDIDRCEPRVKTKSPQAASKRNAR